MSCWILIVLSCVCVVEYLFMKVFICGSDFFGVGWLVCLWWYLGCVKICCWFLVVSGVEYDLGFIL